MAKKQRWNKYELTRPKMPKKIIKKKSKAVYLWAKAQSTWSRLTKLWITLTILMVLVFAWLGIFSILQPFNEPIAAYMSSLFVFLFCGILFALLKSRFED